MLEALLIMSIVYACMYMPLRGKRFDQLTESQKARVHKNYVKYMNSRKGRETPGMTIEQYLPIIAKQGLTFLIMAIVLIPIYILAVVFLYRNMF